MKKLLSFLLLSWLALNAGHSQSISPFLAGQNAWLPTALGSQIYNGQLDQLWPVVRQSKVKMIRIGGNGVNSNLVTNQQYIALIDSIRRIGAEPMVQVSEGRGRFTAAQAAQVVNHVNITMHRNVKYWIIGNEPDLNNAAHPTPTNVAGVEAYIKAFASAMKAVDPSILIVGPENASYGGGYFPALVGGANDITGTDANGRYYIDVLSFHTYPFSGTQTRAAVVSGAQNLTTNVTNLLGLMANANALHARTGANALRWALTEFNVDYANPTANTVEGVGVHSFLNGQFWAEVFGVGMKYEAVSMQPWSIHEGSGARGTGDLGYLDGSGPTIKPRSAFWHEMLVAENMHGTNLNATDNQALVKVLSSTDNGTTAVMVLNESDATNYDFTVQLSTATASGTAALKINVPAGINVAYNDKIYAQSTLVLLFNSQGALTRKIVYSLQHAQQTLPPTYLNPGQSVTLASFSADKTFTCTAPEAVTFTASVLGEATSISWDFGVGASPATGTGTGPIAVTYTSAGNKTIALTLVNADTTIVMRKANYLPVSACVRTPYSGTAAVVPGVVKAVEYDNGGENVAYHDTEVANRGTVADPNAPRPNEGVDTSNSGEGIGEVGYTASGEWLKYTVSVLRTGLYRLAVRVSTGATSTGSVRLSVNDVDRSGVVAVPATGSFGTYQDVIINNVYLEASPNTTLKLDIVSGGFNFSKLTFTEQEAPGIVVNRIYNATSTPDGLSDAVELLVVKDHTDIRSLIIKDFESSLTSDAGGKYQFRDHALWQNLRIGTTIVLRRLASGITGYAEDLDPTDFKLDLLMENATYLTTLSSANQSFNLTNTDMVLLKTGSAAGTDNAVHALVTNNGGGTAFFAAVTSPKLVFNSTLGTGSLLYPLNPAQSPADYNSSSVATSTSASRNWGDGFGTANTNYINTLRNAAFTAPTIVVNRIYNGSNDANGITDAVELLVVQDHLDIRNLVVKDFETNNTADNGGKFRFNNVAFWQDLRQGTTIVLRRLAGPTGYAQDTDASDFTLDLLMENTSYLTNLATSNSFNITQYDMVLLKTGTAAGVDGAIHAFATKGGGSNGVPTAMYQSVRSAKMTSPDGTDAGGGTFHYPLNPDQALTDYNGVKGALSKSPDLSWGYGFGTANVAYIKALRDSTFAPPTVAWQGNATTCAGTAANLTLELTGQAPWTLGLASGNQLSTLQVFAIEVNAANEYTLAVSPTATTTFRITSIVDAHRKGVAPTDSAIVTVLTAPVLTVQNPADATAAYGQSSASVAFAATATGAPQPALTYTIVRDSIVTAIASPYSFPVGTTTVTPTAANSCASVTGTFTVTVLGTPASVRVLHQDGDNQLTNNSINPNLQLRNETAAAIPYSELTVRYWLTAEEYAPVQAVADWAQLGTSNVRLRYVPLAQPVQGAFGYVEYAFTAAAGSLPAGGNSGPIQSRISKQNWTNFNEADDFSYAGSRSYALNDHLTVYRNGALVGGVEPAPVAAVSALKVLAQNTSSTPTGNSISLQLQLRNEGNQPAAYSDLTVRYWFSPDGPAALNYYVDYTPLGNANVQLSTGLASAETYAEMRFAAALGTLAPLSGTGTVQLRITKADWSNFMQANDFSYQPKGPLAENTRITAYVKGQLVYGQEPAGAQAAARGTAAALATAGTRNQSALLEAYPNPFADRAVVHFRPSATAVAQVQVYNALGQLVATLYDGPAEAGHDYELTLEGSRLPAGVYTCRLLNSGTAQTERLVLVR